MKFYDMKNKNIKVELVTELPLESKGRIVFSLKDNAFYFGMFSGWMGLGVGSTGGIGAIGQSGSVGLTGGIGGGPKGKTGGTGISGYYAPKKPPLIFEAYKEIRTYHNYNTTEVIIHLYTDEMKEVEFNSTIITSLSDGHVGVTLTKKLMEKYKTNEYHLFVLPLSNYIITLEEKYPHIFKDNNYQEIIQLPYYNKLKDHILDIKIKDKCNIISPCYFIDYNGNIHTSEVIANLMGFENCQTAELSLHTPMTGYLFIKCLEHFNLDTDDSNYDPDSKYVLEKDVHYTITDPPTELYKEGSSWSITHAYKTLPGLTDRDNFTIDVYDENGDIIPVFPYNGTQPHKRFYYELNPDKIPPLYKIEIPIIDNPPLNLDDGFWHDRKEKLLQYIYESETNPNLIPPKLSLCPTIEQQILSYNINNLNLPLTNNFKIENNNLIIIKNTPLTNTNIISPIILKDNIYNISLKLYYNKEIYYKNNYSPDYLVIIIAKHNSNTLSLVISRFDKLKDKLSRDRYNHISIVYNLGQFNEKIISDGSSLIDTTINWSKSNPIDINVYRVNNLISIYINHININIDLNTELLNFQNPCQIGFGTIGAQVGGVFENILITTAVQNISNYKNQTYWDYELIDNVIRIVFYRYNQSFPVKAYQKGKVKITFNGNKLPIHNITGKIIDPNNIITEEEYNNLSVKRTCKSIYNYNLTKNPINTITINQQIKNTYFKIENYNSKNYNISIYDSDTSSLLLDNIDYELVHLDDNQFVIYNYIVENTNCINQLKIIDPCKPTTSPTISTNITETNLNNNQLTLDSESISPCSSPDAREVIPRLLTVVLESKTPPLINPIKTILEEYNEYKKTKQIPKIYTHIQECKSNKWIIKHNLNSKNINPTIYNLEISNIVKVNNYIIKYLDNNTLELSFTRYSLLNYNDLNDDSWIYNQNNIPNNIPNQIINYNHNETQRIILKNSLEVSLCKHYYQIQYSDPYLYTIPSQDTNPEDYILTRTCNNHQYEYTGATGQPGTYITIGEPGTIPVVFHNNYIKQYNNNHSKALDITPNKLDINNWDDNNNYYWDFKYINTNYLVIDFIMNKIYYYDEYRTRHIISDNLDNIHNVSSPYVPYNSICSFNLSYFDNYCNLQILLKNILEPKNIQVPYLPNKQVQTSDDNRFTNHDKIDYNSRNAIELTDKYQNIPGWRELIKPGYDENYISTNKEHPSLNHAFVFITDESGLPFLTKFVNEYINEDCYIYLDISNTTTGIYKITKANKEELLKKLEHKFPYRIETIYGYSNGRRYVRYRNYYKEYRINYGIRSYWAIEALNRLRSRNPFICSYNLVWIGYTLEDYDLYSPWDNNIHTYQHRNYASRDQIRLFCDLYDINMHFINTSPATYRTLRQPPLSWSLGTSLSHVDLFRNVKPDHHSKYCRGHINWISEHTGNYLFERSSSIIRSGTVIPNTWINNPDFNTYDLCKHINPDEAPEEIDFRKTFPQLTTIGDLFQEFVNTILYNLPNRIELVDMSIQEVYNRVMNYDNLYEQPLYIQNSKSRASYWEFTGGTGCKGGQDPQNWVYVDNSHIPDTTSYWQYNIIHPNIQDKSVKILTEHICEPENTKFKDSYDELYYNHVFDNPIFSISPDKFSPTEESYNQKLPLKNKSLLINPKRYYKTPIKLDYITDTDSNIINILNNINKPPIKYQYTNVLKYTKEHIKPYYKFDIYNKNYLSSNYNTDTSSFFEPHFVTYNDHISGKAILQNLDPTPTDFNSKTHPNIILYEQENPNTKVWIIDHNYPNSKYDVQVYDNNHNLIPNDNYQIRNNYYNLEIHFLDCLSRTGYALLTRIPDEYIRPITAYSGTGGTGSKGEIREYLQWKYRGFTGFIGSTGRTGRRGSSGCSGGTGGIGNTGGSGFTGETGGMGSTSTTGRYGGTGDKGPTGGCGYAADPLLTGGTGAIGNIGPTGGTGHPGATGEIGGSGGRGPTGGTGIPGTGKTGDTGNSGSFGERGKRGTTGNEGTQGKSYLNITDLVYNSVIITEDHNTKIEDYNIKIYSNYFKHILKPNIFIYDKIFKNYLVDSTIPEYLLGNILNSGLDINVTKEIEDLQDTEVLINIFDEDLSFKIDINGISYDLTTDITQNAYLSYDLTQVYIKFPNLAAIYTNDYKILDNIPDPRTQGILDKYKNKDSSNKPILQNFIYNKNSRDSLLVIDMKTNILSGDLIPWSFYANLDYLKRFEYVEKDVNAQVFVKIGTETHIHGAVYLNLTTLYGE